LITALRRSELEFEKQHNHNHNRCAGQTSDENCSPDRGMEGIRRSRQITGTVASGVSDTTQEWAVLAALPHHLVPTHGTLERDLHVDNPCGQLGVVFEPPLDQLGQLVELPFSPVEVLGMNSHQRESEPTRQFVLLGVSLGLRRMVMLRTVELHREQRHLVSSRNHEVVMRLEGELVQRLGQAGPFDREDIR
jgi:hypothetical protein